MIDPASPGGAEVFRSFPQPGGYETYFDYEQALLDWKVRHNNAGLL
jgi:hypothetical protein